MGKDELRKEEEVGKKTQFEWDDDLPGCVAVCGGRLDPLIFSCC